MASFLLTLPQELQCEIASFLGRDDLRALRFSCGMLLAPATRSLFAFIRLYPTYKSIERYNKIISHPEFKKHVRYVEFNFNTLEKAENLNDKAFMQSPQVQCVLRKVKALRLYIVSERASPEAHIEMEELHGFMRELHPLWLSPASNNLTTLTLYQDVPFGFCPKLDLRGVHLPALRTFALGNYSFSHTWQLDFLSAHASTLENLYLDRCMVIYYTDRCSFDDDGYPALERLEPQENRFYADTMTWSRIFDHLRENMRNLHRFSFGKSSRWHELVKCVLVRWDENALWDENNTRFDALAYETMEQNVDTAYQMLDIDMAQPHSHSDLVSREGTSYEHLRANMLFRKDISLHTEEGKKAAFFLTHIKEQYREDVRAFEKLLDSIKYR